MPAYDTFFAGTSAWNVLMKSMIFITGNRPTIQTFTPSKVNGTFNGWGTLNITDNMLGDKFMPCLTSIQGGSKMVLFGGDTIESSVYILDMATLTWTKSSPVPTTFSACGVAGDQVIVWGGAYNYTLTGKTHVYNMKTEKWVSTYTAPSTTLQQPTQHDTTTATDSPDSDKSSSNDTKLVIIISVTIAVVLAVMVTAMILFLRRTRRLNSGDIKSTTSNNPSSGSLETMYEVNVHDKVPSDTLAHSRDPAYSDLSAAVAQDPHTEMKQNVWSQMGRLHEGSAGALLDPAHPHAVVQEEETKRNVQMGSFGARPVSQHPHACPDMKTIATYNNDKAELDEPHAYSDKTIAATYNSDKAELDEWKK
ncbi:hypothetical protein B0O80DRAFT_440632 [Mortierella sp. GBAus27b]|nr:hypothetical protein B0O80DRAFT_440632 [Mortierella sp. GBAus27b]